MLETMRSEEWGKLSLGFSQDDPGGKVKGKRTNKKKRKQKRKKTSMFHPTCLWRHYVILVESLGKKVMTFSCCPLGSETPCRQWKKTCCTRLTSPANPQIKLEGGNDGKKVKAKQKEEALCCTTLWESEEGMGGSDTSLSEAFFGDSVPSEINSEGWAGCVEMPQVPTLGDAAK
ncbi:hypothetical protein HNY73_007254 [Argiope bruennichi]|uniref:Uncharacterized protein n=1 Tax=Argiope bruennichi TaxID=94029 RepID=A0A8T0FIX7_ARGBR|nr:hypothetical protein HNY73_007254 [Argiope bruennichi]